MATVTTNDLRVRNAKNLVSYLTEDRTNPSYMFIGRPAEWEFDTRVPTIPRVDAGENSPPYPANNNKDFYRTWDQMLALDKIDSSEVFHMIPRINWTSGVVYDMYRHDYDEITKSHSNASNLYNSVFYVINSQNMVYVCLDNVNDTVSTVEPLSTSDTPFYTSDGYQWLRLYEINSSTLLSYASNNLIPIVNNNVNSGFVEGEVHTVRIDSRGQGFLIPLDTPFYYCRIVGGGTGAIARVRITGGIVSEIRIMNSGSGYTYGTLDFKANRVYKSMIDLKDNKNALNPLGDGDLRTTVIISPPGGWGYDLVRELGGTRVGVFSDFKSYSDSYLVEPSFRQVGIMSELQGYTETDNLGNIIYPQTRTVTHAVIVNENVGTKTKDYKLYETITQTRRNPDDPTIKYVAKGMVVGWDDVTNVLQYIQDPHLHTADDGVMYEFTGNTIIRGEESEKESTPRLTPALSEVEGRSYRSGYSVPQVTKYSGEMIYLTNINPVKRSPTQTERVSLVISY